MAGAFPAKYHEFLPPGSEDVWVETGTYRGKSVTVALGFGFRELHTIEVCPARFRELETLHPVLCNDPRVHRYLGSSRDVLPPIIASRTHRDVVFWLDAHYQGESPDERDAVSECPILDELDAIIHAPWQRSVLIVIDDSNLFTEAYWMRGVGRERFTRSDWPSENQLADIMHGWRSMNTEHILYFYR